MTIVHPHPLPPGKAAAVVSRQVRRALVVVRAPAGSLSRRRGGADGYAPVTSSSLIHPLTHAPLGLESFGFRRTYYSGIRDTGNAMLFFFWQWERGIGTLPRELPIHMHIGYMDSR